MKIFANMDPKNNRLPKKTTGIISEAKFTRVPFVNPDAFVNNHPGIQRNLKQFDNINPSKIRSEAKARITAQVAAVNRQISKSAMFKGLTFAVHNESGRAFAVIKNQKTGQVLKQIPSGESLSRASLMKNASGLLKDITI